MEKKGHPLLPLSPSPDHRVFPVASSGVSRLSDTAGHGSQLEIKNRHIPPARGVVIIFFFSQHEHRQDVIVLQSRRVDQRLSG